MFANLICDPPLGHVTIVDTAEKSAETKVTFTVTIECETSSTEQHWEVVLWNDFCSATEWSALDFTEIAKENMVHHFSTGSSLRNPRRRLFRAELKGRPAEERSVRFTVRFRPAPHEAWKWVNESFHQTDGEILYRRSGTGSHTPLKDCFNLEPGFRVSEVLSQSPGATVYRIEGKANAAVGRSSSYQDLPFGTPKAYSRWMALVRLWSPWLAPRQGRVRRFFLDSDAVFCSFLMQNGQHLAFLALSGLDDVRTLLASGRHDQVRLSVRSDGKEEGICRVLAAIGESFEIVMAAVMYQARDMAMAKSQPSMRTEKLEAEFKAVASQPIRPEWIENWYDGLSYCTWNGLGQNLTEEKIFVAMNSLEKNNVHITNLIIDDNWQSLVGMVMIGQSPMANHGIQSNKGDKQFRRGWMEFEANKEGFPKGLKHTVTKLRERQPNIKHVAVWHALNGYWGGIAPEGKLAAEYKTVDVVNQKGLSDDDRTYIAAEDISRFFDDFYRFLTDCGVDSVKTDAQFYLDELEHADDRRNLIRSYQDAWAIASLRWFSVKAISCMSQIPQMIFHSQLPNDRPRVLLRNSDDFYPEVPASHPWHIFCNAHNSLLNQHLNVLPDWDMFQTDHPWASFHAAARCVSGGPVYFTDEPGKHNIDLIGQMSAKTVTGKTIVLRPSNIGKSLSHYVGYDELRLLRVGSFHGTMKEGSGILGLFNINQEKLSELIPLRDFPGVLGELSYIVRAHTTGQTTPILHKGSELSLVGIDLHVRGCEILTAHPVHFVQNSIGIAVLGLVGKMTGVAALLSSQIEEPIPGKVEINISIKALGTLGLFVSNIKEKTVADNFLVTLYGKVIPMHTVEKDEANKVLKIDVATAWEEMGLESRFTNEVWIQIVMT